VPNILSSSHHLTGRCRWLPRGLLMDTFWPASRSWLTRSPLLQHSGPRSHTGSPSLDRGQRAERARGISPSARTYSARRPRNHPITNPASSEGLLWVSGVYYFSRALQPSAQVAPRASNWPVVIARPSPHEGCHIETLLLNSRPHSSRGVGFICCSGRYIPLP
jgi:hypothetical protein